MFVLGISGGIGCGKSTAAAILQAHGMELLDADVISHEVTARGGVAIPEIIEQFGAVYVREDGSLDRQAMANLVFHDRTKLDQLSLIVHKHVMAEMTRRRLKFAKAKTKALVLDVPVPVKEGFLDACDQIWIIWADEDVRVSRLEGRGMSEAEARQRMSIQMTMAEYQALGTELIMNNSSIAELEAQLDELIRRELIGRGIPLKTGQLYAVQEAADAPVDADADADELVNADAPVDADADAPDLNIKTE